MCAYNYDLVISPFTIHLMCGRFALLGRTGMPSGWPRSRASMRLSPRELSSSASGSAPVQRTSEVCVHVCCLMDACACVYVFMCVCVRVYCLLEVCACVRAYVRGMHVSARLSVWVCACAFVCLCVRLCVRLSVYAYVRAHLRPCMRACACMCARECAGV